MTAIDDKEYAFENLTNATIEKRLVDISSLPLEMVDCITRVYREFIACYLNVLRQREGKSADWMPERLYIEPELADQMRHFFSDYQHITRQFHRLNQRIDKLHDIDKTRQPKLYRHMVDDILEEFNPRVNKDDEHEYGG